MKTADFSTFEAVRDHPGRRGNLPHTDWKSACRWFNSAPGHH